MPILYIMRFWYKYRGSFFRQFLKNGKLLAVNYPAGIYMFKVNNRNARTKCKICLKLTLKAPERRQWRRFGVFIVNFEHILHFVLAFLLLTLSM